MQVSCTGQHQIERVLLYKSLFTENTVASQQLFHARNLHKKNLAASRYDRHASFLYKFLVHVSPALLTEIIKRHSKEAELKITLLFTQYKKLTAPNMNSFFSQVQFCQQFRKVPKKNCVYAYCT